MPPATTTSDLAHFEWDALVLPDLDGVAFTEMQRGSSSDEPAAVHSAAETDPTTEQPGTAGRSLRPRRTHRTPLPAATIVPKHPGAAAAGVVTQPPPKQLRSGSRAVPVAHRIEPKYPRTGRRGAPQVFPRKLFDILNEEDPAVVGWNESGMSFMIHDMDTFVDVILLKYFKHQKYASFQRQLNLYGFRKIQKGPETGAYAHEFFLREHPANLVKVRRMPQSASYAEKAAAAAKATAAAEAVTASAIAAMSAKLAAGQPVATAQQLDSGVAGKGSNKRAQNGELVIKVTAPASSAAASASSDESAPRRRRIPCPTRLTDCFANSDEEGEESGETDSEYDEDEAAALNGPAPWASATGELQASAVLDTTYAPSPNDGELPVAGAVHARDFRALPPATAAVAAPADDWGPCVTQQPGQPSAITRAASDGSLPDVLTLDAQLASVAEFQNMAWLDELDPVTTDVDVDVEVGPTPTAPADQSVSPAEPAVVVVQEPLPLFGIPSAPRTSPSPSPSPHRKRACPAARTAAEVEAAAPAGAPESPPSPVGGGLAMPSLARITSSMNSIHFDEHDVEYLASFIDSLNLEQQAQPHAQPPPPPGEPTAPAQPPLAHPFATSVVGAGAGGRMGAPMMFGEFEPPAAVGAVACVAFDMPPLEPQRLRSISMTSDDWPAGGDFEISPDELETVFGGPV